MENDTVTLKCSTLSSCPLNLQIQDLKAPPTEEHQVDERKKSITARLKVTWLDDGKQFSCQTQDNNDRYLIKNVSVTVECKFMNGEFIDVMSAITVVICNLMIAPATKIKTQVSLSN